MTHENIVISIRTVLYLSVAFPLAIFWLTYGSRIRYFGKFDIIFVLGWTGILIGIFILGATAILP